MKQTKILRIVVIVLAIGAIALTTYKKMNKQEAINSSTMMEKMKDKRVLVLFFSRAGDNYKVGKVEKGNTAFLAEYIAEITDADVFEITSKKNYDIPYTEMLKVVREEWKNDEYPEFNKPLRTINEYDIIFVGGPIWWGTYPRVMFSFFKEHDLNGKIIIPFVTHEGSGLGNTKVDLQRLFPKATVIDGFSMPGQEARKPEARETVKQWLDGLDFQDKVLSKNDNTDGLTGATTLNNQLTEKGQKCEKQIKRVLDIKFQDGHIDYDELDAFFSVNKKLADKYGMQCWTNAESFDRDMPIRFLPIKFDKLRMKLEAAKRAGYDKAITFEFSHFMSPQSAYLQAGHLYDRYKEYFEIK